jgi:antitoxin ParD1/3/4
MLGWHDEGCHQLTNFVIRVFPFGDGGSAMATMNVSLPGPMKEWVESRMKDGKFSNTSDYVRHLIRRDQERAEAVAEIQKAVDEAIASGEPRPFDFEGFKARMHEQHGRR